MNLHTYLMIRTATYQPSWLINKNYAHIFMFPQSDNIDVTSEAIEWTITMQRLALHW